MDRHIADMPRLVPQLRGTIMLPGRGHITQEERAAEVSAVMMYMFCCIPFGLAALLMFRFVHITLGKPQTVSAHEECRE